jgi:RNA polymerase sigma-70 factor (ECF subfamily)
MGAERGNDPARLIQEIARGDREAFERFYDRYASLVYTLALRILRVRSDARDPAQVFAVTLEPSGRCRRRRAQRSSSRSNTRPFPTYVKSINVQGCPECGAPGEPGGASRGVRIRFRCP